MNKKQIRNSLIVAVLVSILCASSYYVGVYSSYVGTTTEVWVNPPFSEVSYVIGQYNSTYYYAKNSTTGKFDFGNVAVGGGYVSTNASYVINEARNALGSLATGASGDIFVKKGIYGIDSPITIGKWTHLICESGTTFNVTTDLLTACIVIDPTNLAKASWSVENLIIQMNQKNGDGIYSTQTTHSGGQSEDHIENTQIYNVKTGYSGFDLTNVFNIHIKDIRMTTYGAGITIRQTGVANDYGNSQIDNIRIGLAGTGAKGFYVITGVNGQAFNMATVNNLEVLGGNYADTKGIDIEGFDASHHESKITFVGGTIESCATNILLNNTIHMAFFNTYIGTSGNGNYAIRIIGDSYGNEFFGSWITASTTGIGYSDESTSTSYIKNLLWGVRLSGASNDFGTMTRLRSCAIYKPSAGLQRYTENTITVTNSTTTTFTITHGLYAAPTNVLPSFNTTQIDGWTWTATSTTITITVHNRVTTDSIVACYCYCECHPNG